MKKALEYAIILLEEYNRTGKIHKTKLIDCILFCKDALGKRKDG